ncbi:MAG: hypothetical protein AT711_00650 [Thermoproteus sp. CIS_19]|nr:MAG: hypothetical protein AT711_00650 [Thermoproteus sp. CIS_19]
MGFSRPFEVRFTEDGLAVGGRRRFYVPRDAVVGGGVVCIRRSPVGLELRISHGLVDYTIPLSQGQYDALVNALNTYWGWAPPECPRARFEPGATTTPMAPETTSSEGVLWRWGARKYGILYSIGLGGAVVGLFFFALVLSAIIGTIAWILHWVGGLATLIITVVVVAVVGVVALMTRGTLKWLGKSSSPMMASPSQIGMGVSRSYQGTMPWTAFASAALRRLGRMARVLSTS